MTDMKG